MKKQASIGDIEDDGVWLTKSLAASSVGVSSYKFVEFSGKFKQKNNVRGYVEYFIPYENMRKESRDNFKEMRDAQQVEDIIGDVTGGIELFPNVSDELKAAQLDNLKARTKLVEEKLENRKQELWSEWNSEFFNTFTEAFAKLKNDIISLHLNEEQIATFQEKLENALKVMKDRLDGMWNRFKEEEEEQEK